jgi:hypothetical protein
MEPIDETGPFDSETPPGVVTGQILACFALAAALTFAAVVLGQAL